MKDSEQRKIAIVGQPNVGKSVLFTSLTGRYATASNYPGTTVEVLRGKVKIDSREVEYIDTPGMYSLASLTEEERVARLILADERPDVGLHVVDARNLERMLPLTLQLLETGRRLILVVNMLDEAESEGISIDFRLLSARLGIPVVGTVSVSGIGVKRLRDEIVQTLADSTRPARVPVEYPADIAEAAERIAECLQAEYGLDKRALALLLLGGDNEAEAWIKERETNAVQAAIGEIAAGISTTGGTPLPYQLAIARQRAAQKALAGAQSESARSRGIREWLSRVMINPVTGLPVLLLILYWGLYRFVGGFGAGTVVDFLESFIFEEHVNPFLTGIFNRILPWPILQSLFVGEYGLLTLGLRYSLAIILPIVAFFFLVFAIIEDSGYLPRLALLLDRTFKKIGLSGRAVIPMVLGLGCDTMATMVTRTLPTRRERFLSTMLLALAIPCSAQLGVILALLKDRTAAMLIWVLVIGGVFLAVGYLGAKLLPGTGPSFYMELPPLRLPKLSNVLTKTYVRIKWYLTEIIPFFLLASLLIWIGQATRLFDLCIRLLRQPVALIGLPREAAEVFLLGFFRRDYGAAGLYDLDKQGLLTGTQLVVACVALTLFLPCVAQLLINIKERGWKAGVAISTAVLVLSFGVAFALNGLLTGLGVAL